MGSVKPPEKTPLLRESTGGIIILAVFIASRLIFSFMGGAFIAKPLSFAMQYLDPVLLKNDLLQSLFYLHAQPPLFNLMLGLMLKLSPVPALSYSLLFKTAGALFRLPVRDALSHRRETFDGPARDPCFHAQSNAHPL